jgi:hypothetical protein
MNRQTKILVPGSGNQIKVAPYVKRASAEVNEWENEKPGFLKQTADFIFWPAEKAAEALIPDGITEAVGKAIEQVLSLIASGTSWTFDPDVIRSSVRKRIRHRKTPSLADRLKAADEQARELWNWHICYAIAEGAATGSLGLPGIAADIPALFGILIREIQEIGTCYGYEISKPEECDYLLHVLRTGSTTSIKEKIGFVVSLKEFEQILINVAWKRMSEALAAKQISKLSLLAAIRQFAKSLGIQITKRKALQMIPVIGGLVGGSFNGMFANDVGKAAYMNYRRRWIADHSRPSDDNRAAISSTKRRPRRPKAGQPLKPGESKAAE